jgi:streptogramin lyase
MDGTDDVDDEEGARVGTNRHRRGNRGSRRRSAGAQEMPSAENKDESENERAGGEPPARRREGVQHVVNDDNKRVTRGCRKRARTSTEPPADSRCINDVTKWLLPLAAVAAACTSSAQATGGLRARVAPAPTAVTTASWSPTITLRRDGRPAAARLALTIRKGKVSRKFSLRAQRRGVYKVRVVFPSNGRWSWRLDAGSRSLARGAISVSASLRFDLPYDLTVLGDGTILFLDRGRILRLDAPTRRVSLYAQTPSQELIAMERLDDGTLFVTDFPANRILRVDPARRSSVVAQVDAPADLVVDSTGQTMWVASIAPGVGVVRVDVKTGRVEPFASVEAPHGIDRDAAGNFYVHDGDAMSRIDCATGAVTRFADVDGIKLLVAPDGSVYGVVGSPAGGRVVRVAPDGTVTTVVGTGSLSPQQDGPALEAGILPSAVQFAPDGSLIVTQVEPIPAIRRVDRPGGTITTLVRGRRR